MFEDIKSNKQSKRFLQNELRREKSSGTYLFNGKKGSNTLELAIAFAKAILCENMKDDFCGECSNCKRIDSGNYPDIHFYGREEAIKIDEVRDIIYKASSSSFEGNKRIFILENIEQLRKEAANALLKTIEEPEDGTYFLLSSNTLNIIPTILSRSILINVMKKSAEELGVTSEEYEFFFGDVRDVEEYSTSDLKIDGIETYEHIGKILSEYSEEKTLKNKIRFYSSLRDFTNNRSFLDKIDKVYFAQEVAKGCGRDRGLAEEVMYKSLLLSKSSINLEKLLELKGYNKSNVNLGLLLKIFFLNF